MDKSRVVVELDVYKLVTDGFIRWGKRVVRNFSKKYIWIGRNEESEMIKTQMEEDMHVFLKPLEKICDVSFEVYELDGITQDGVNFLFPLFVEYENMLYHLLIHHNVGIDYTWKGRVYEEIRRYGKKKKNLKCAELLIRVLNSMISTQSETLFHQLRWKLVELYAFEYEYESVVDKINIGYKSDTIDVSLSIENLITHIVQHKLRKNDSIATKRQVYIKTIYDDLDEACCAMQNLSYLPDSPFASIWKQMYDNEDSGLYTINSFIKNIKSSD